TYIDRGSAGSVSRRLPPTPGRAGITQPGTQLADQLVIDGAVLQHLTLGVHHAHGVGGDLVDDHYLTINQADLDLHVDQGQALVTQVGLDDAAHTAGQLLSLGEVGRAEQTDGDHGVIVDQRVTALIVLDSDLDQIVEPGLGIADVLLVAADEA